MKTPHTIQNSIRNILILLLSLFYFPAHGSHIVGGEFTYRFVSESPGGNNYEFRLTIYEDCLNAKPGVIGADNPAYLAVYDVSGGIPLSVDSVFSINNDSVPSNFNNACITNPPALCLLKRTFVFNYFLPYSSSGYLISYQKCCRNATIANIADPGNTGSTYFCIIPPSPYINNSAVFKNYPPQIICINNPLDYDNSATDLDGDSLSYEFCNALVGGEGRMPSPAPAPPPYDSVTWLTPTYYYNHPMTGFPPIQIDPVTGHITGTPNRLGRYLVTVCCHEWRRGVLVNTVKREFQFVVTNCSKAVVACMPQFSTDINTYIINCTDYHVHFVNCSSGGTTWRWDFGVPGSQFAQSNVFEPDFTFPDTGTYSVKLVVNPGSTCQDSITRLVKIYPVFSSAFSENGQQCSGDTVIFTDQSASTVKPIDYWKWNFGDGDSSFLQNPSHRYLYGGTYKVILISKNAKNCIDTSMRQVVIENFVPFAGNDTIIVKGEKVQFNATGGNKYTWTPTTNLTDPNVFNPVGYYPDTGRFTYYVHIESSFGCTGSDTVKVTVVNQAEFFMPNAFSPNGDGKNDIFRPIAVGYSGLKYFRIFNRFGQVVYNNTTLDGGWDGTFNGKLCDLDTYYWEIFFTDRFGKDSFLKGDVTLIR